METGRQGPWILTVERGPSAGAGGRRRGPVRFCPFWRSSSGRCPLPPLGPEGGEPATAAPLRRPPPLPVRCRRIAAGTGGWASSREGRAGSPAGRAEPGGCARSQARGFDGFYCLRERPCVLTAAAAAAAGPCPARAAPARFRGAGPGPGIRGRRGGGGGGGARRRRRYNPLPAAGRLHTRALRSPHNSGEPGLPAPPPLLHGGGGSSGSALHPP